MLVRVVYTTQQCDQCTMSWVPFFLSRNALGLSLYSVRVNTAYVIYI